MKHIFVCALAILMAIAPLADSQNPKVPDPPNLFKTGAIPTSFPKIIASIKAGNSGVYRATAPPPQVLMVPKRLSAWGNNQYGNCVTVESVFAISAYSCYVGLDQIYVTEATCIDWARAHGGLNGAMLLDVIQDMQRDGVKDEKGVLRKAGKPSTVDFSNEDTLKSAIAQGPVSIAIASGSLPSGARSGRSGWFAFGGRQNNQTDHCVGLSGYGPTAELFKSLNVAAPANAPANGYLLFTWGTIGVVDHQWLMNTCVEAWVRNPTVTDLVPPPSPPPPPNAITVSAANVTGAIDAPVKFSPTASGGVSPYIFLFEYGDSIMDAAGTHTYKAAGAYKVTITAVDSRGAIGTGTCVAAIGTAPPPPGPGPGPGPFGSGIISWTIGGVTSSYELFPPGTRQKLSDVIGPMAP